MAIFDQRGDNGSLLIVPRPVDPEVAQFLNQLEQERAAPALLSDYLFGQRDG